jgi:polyphosphate glucokinase
VRGRGGKRTLAIDVGGTFLKVATVLPDGAVVAGPFRVPSPAGQPPERYVAALSAIAREAGRIDRVSVGFPGVVRGGIVRTAPNLRHRLWSGFPLADRLSEALGAPCLLLNDADLHGLGIVDGSGMEVVCTLGTGFGTAFFQDGRLGPHLEFAHLRFEGELTYDVSVGDAEMKRVPLREWRRRVVRTLEDLRTLTLFDRLHLGGGNARFVRLPARHRDVRIIGNEGALLGAVRLWEPIAAKPSR